MSNIRQSPSKRRVLLVLAFLTSAIAACDARVTAPAEIHRASVKPAAIDGDTASCRRGWIIVTGAYVCL
jgi:hypothetical protein